MKQENDTIELIFKALADNTRLRIIKILLKKDSYTEYLASCLNLSAPTITYHMTKLEKAKIVFSEKIKQYTIYSINRELMKTTLGDFIDEFPDIDKQDQYERKVISNFFEYNKLKSIPVQLKKREIVIGYIASKLEMNKIYSEKELVCELIDIYDDYCTIRRDLIGMDYLEDLGGRYRRIR